ncbi:glycine betaine ABC transporter substrate-binding protein [Sutcliffiella deserti]|uniref:glycine betaine ABC transporter substrate-binding protein n=1 Tax=Sutcliffiella deserti TaxID=2875501 RepID=UPI001CBBF1E1|nr:glycine betaine ABC transporter substrate-binding protein [Sutcliffiella deserti]
MKKNTIMMVIILSSAILLSACGGGGNEKDGEGEKGTLKFGINNWAENIAVSNMWKVLLEEKGYSVELKELEKAAVWTGIAQNDLDVAPEIWLPKTDEPLYERYKDDIVKRESWYEGTGLGFAVPTYLENINSIEDLNANNDTLGGRIIGIESGTSLMELANEAINEYDIELDLVQSSEPAMLSELKKAHDLNEPIVVTLWNPHWVFAEYELKYLEDPKKTFGEQDDIFYMTRKDFEKDHEEVVKWMDKWKMNDDELGDLMSMINETSPEEGAKKWIEQNRELVDNWLSK